MRWCSIPMFLLACGGPVYLPVEPPARRVPADTGDLLATGDTGGDDPSAHSASSPEHTGRATPPPPWGCSTDDGYSTSIWVENLTGRPVTLFWVDPSCQEVLVTGLAPSASTGLYTWTRHVFVVRDDATGEVVGSYEVTQGGATWSVKG